MQSRPQVTELNDVVSDTSFDAQAFIPKHRGDSVGMAAQYLHGMRAAVTAAAWTEGSLMSVAEQYEEACRVVHPRTLGEATKDTVRIHPYSTWAGAVRSAEQNQVPEKRRDEYIDAYFGMTIAHELLHTLGLPHVKGWAFHTPNRGEANVMSYEVPTSTDTTYTYQMSSRQAELAQKALDETTAYHDILKDKALPDVKSELRALWLRDFTPTIPDPLGPAKK